MASWGWGGGSEAENKVRVPQICPEFRAPFNKVYLFLEETFLMWGGGGRGGGLAEGWPWGGGPCTMACSRLCVQSAALSLVQAQLQKGGKSLPSAQAALQSLVSHMRAFGEPIIRGSTSICIVPGYPFQLCDALITNFHQPDSTLLLLVSALMGVCRGTGAGAGGHRVGSGPPASECVACSVRSPPLAAARGLDVALYPWDSAWQGVGGIEVRKFPQFFHICFFLVQLAWLLVPCVPPVPKCCSLRCQEVWLWHRSSPAIFGNWI